MDFTTALKKLHFSSSQKFYSHTCILLSSDHSCRRNPGSEKVFESIARSSAWSASVFCLAGFLLSAEAEEGLNRGLIRFSFEYIDVKKAHIGNGKFPIV